MAIALSDAPQIVPARRPDDLRIIAGAGKPELEQFCGVPFALPEVRKLAPQPKFLERHTLENMTRSRAFAGSALFVATDATGVPRGRAAAIFNHQHLEKFADGTGFFGFFDCVDDAEVGRKLLEHVCDHFAGKGVRRIVGPVSPTINYSPGLLIDGRDSPSSYSTANTPDYYPTLVESAGFERLEDLYGYGLDHSQRLPELRGTDTRRVTLRPFRRTELITRLGELWSLYVNSFHANWFELPIDKGEFQGLITALVLLGPRGYVLVAEAERRFVGFTVAAPELNDTFARVQAASGAAGRTWAALRFARVPRARVLFLGVDPDYRGSGLDGRLIRGIWESCRDAGVQMAEASWILGRNYQMRGALRGLGFRTLKRWRLYSKPV